LKPILYLGLFILSLIWGASFFFIKTLLVHYTPIGIVFYRSLFGTVIILLLMLFLRKKIWPNKKDWKILILIGLLNSVIPWSLIGYSETIISSGLASILNATTPIWTLIIGILLFSSKLNRWQIVGIVSGFAGIFILLDIDFSQLQINNISGFLGMIIAAIFYGVSSHLSRKYFQSLSAYQITFFTLAASTGISAAILAVTDSFKWSLFIAEPATLFSFLGLGSLGSGLALVIYYYLIQKGSAEFASLVTYLVPVTALFWGAAILGEAIHPSMIFGLALILSGVYISGRKNKRTVKPLAPMTGQQQDA